MRWHLRLGFGSDPGRRGRRPDRRLGTRAREHGHEATNGAAHGLGRNRTELDRVKGEVKQKWNKLTDEDVEFVKGKYAELLCLLQERYGHAKEQAEQGH